MFLVIHKTLIYVVLTETVELLTKKDPLIGNKVNYLASSFSFLNLDRPSSLIPLHTEIIKVPKTES